MADLFSRIKEIPTTEIVTAFFAGLDLKQDGRGRQKALCPFHAENIPSFTAYENGWKCYGCGAHGSNIDLLLKADLAFSPLEAAQMIAEKFGIEVEQKKPRKQRLLTLSEYAAYVKLPQDFLVKTFHLGETPKGVTFPYRDAAGNQVSVQIRHRLVKGKGKVPRFLRVSRTLPRRIRRLQGRSSYLFALAVKSKLHDPKRLLSGLRNPRHILRLARPLVLPEPEVYSDKGINLG